MYIKGLVLRNAYWLNDFMHGSPIRKHYDDIKCIQEDFSKGMTLKKKYLQNILEYAVTYSSFYKNIDASDLCNFPVVNKLILTENHEEVLVDANDIPGQRGKLFIQRTSGSTGTPFAVPQDTEKRNRRIAELKYFGKCMGFNSHDKLVHLRIWTKWQNKSRYQSFRENIIPFDISNLTDKRLQELCDIIKREKAMTIRGYASSFDLLARYVGEHNIKFPSLKLMIATSESLQDTTREQVKRHIGCDLVSQYADEECGILAQEEVVSDTRIFYLNEATYYWEFLKLDSDEPAEEGELARIVLTDMFNHAFPLIRYDTGDLAVFGKGNKYSRGYPIIVKLYGRRLDMIYDTNGNPVFPMVFARILKNYSEISQWQFVQKEKSKYLLKIVSKSALVAENEISRSILIFLGNDAHLKIKYVSEIPVLSSGKRKCVVNEHADY